MEIYFVSRSKYCTYCLQNNLGQKKTPLHYVERLNKSIDECDFNKLSYAFDIALFKFGEKALELVKNRQYENLFEEYITYTNY